MLFKFLKISYIFLQEKLFHVILTVIFSKFDSLKPLLSQIRANSNNFTWFYESTSYEGYIVFVWSKYPNRVN